MTTPEPRTTFEQPEKKRRHWLLPTAVGVVALIIGYAAGSTGDDETADAAHSDDAGQLESMVDDLTAERDALQEQLDADGEDGGALDARAEQLDDREATIDEREATLDERETTLDERESVAETDAGDQDDADDAADESADDGTYTAGQYRFDDVQVYDDFGGDFALRARVTNTGSTQSGVIWTATLFDGGSVVGTLSGTAQDFEADSTFTVEFFSTDAHTSWDDVEFQVDSQF